jgi:hypothetical protein
MKKLSIFEPPDQVQASVEVSISFCYLQISKSDHNGKITYYGSLKSSGGGKPRPDLSQVYVTTASKRE